MTRRTAGHFRHVLCPVDFSRYSRGALRYASALRRRSQGRLTVLFVNDPLLDAAAAAAAYDVEKLSEKTNAELRRLVARTLGDDSEAVDFTVAVGHPAPQINKAADRLDADLVVMGARGLTGPGKWFFGSTTERVLRTASVPMLVVPDSKNRSQAQWNSALRGWPGKRILVPVDLGDYAPVDLRRAIERVRALGARPILLHVIARSRLPSWLRVDDVTLDRPRVKAARARLRTLAQTLGVDAEYRVAVGDPVAQIAACAAEARAGLIVLTLKRAAGAFGARQGAITYGILCSATTPVLAIPAARQRS